MNNQKIIVGLGNPGGKYKMNRHNIGFIILDIFSRKYSSSFIFSKKFNADIAKVIFSNTCVYLVKPKTFMNSSGEAAAKIAEFYKVSPEDIIVIYDDINLNFGKIRVRKTGSAGGHNGIKSIISSIASQDFPRIKIGIGPKPEGELIDFVLSDFSKDETKELPKISNFSVEILEDIISNNNLDQTMTKYNGVTIL